ncbi:MAG: tight adherence protein [Actinomycetota bacterium]|nr:tight adherence protein [Actinomycetota bacterium]
MTSVLIVVELMATLGVVLVALVILIDNAARERQLREFGAGAARPGVLRRWYGSLSGAVNRSRFGRPVQRRLRGAGTTWNALDYIAGVLAIGVAGAVLLQKLLGILGGLVFVAAVWWGANRWIESRRQKRLEAFVSQLPDVARVLSNAASAGLALPSAIGMASRELEDPAGTELRTVSNQLSLGRSLDQALEELVERLPSRELSVLVQTLVIQSRSGGALVSALINIANALELRKELRREVRTAVSGAIFSGYAVTGIGVVAVLVMNLLSPGALDQLAGTLIGRLVLAVSLTLFLTGFVVIKRMTRIEV